MSDRFVEVANEDCRFGILESRAEILGQIVDKLEPRIWGKDTSQSKHIVLLRKRCGGSCLSNPVGDHIVHGVDRDRSQARKGSTRPSAKGVVLHLDGSRCPFSQDDKSCAARFPRAVGVYYDSGRTQYELSSGEVFFDD